jgi:hypothetical protein
LLAEGGRFPWLIVDYENGLFSLCAHTRNHAIS